MRKGAQTSGGGPLNPLITRDPVTGGELIVTRLEAPQSGLVIEGAFSLGWIGRLTPEQLEFVGHLVRSRGQCAEGGRRPEYRLQHGAQSPR